jgi:hypothetical protein
MATNTSKTKYIIFQARNKNVNMEKFDVLYDANNPNEIANPNLISTLERVHSNHPDIKSRSYKLLGEYLDDYLSLDYHVDNLCRKLNRSLYCGEPAISRHSHHVSLVQLTTHLLPVMRDPGSIPRGVLV